MKEWVDCGGTVFSGHGTHELTASEIIWKTFATYQVSERYNRDYERSPKFPTTSRGVIDS